MDSHRDFFFPFLFIEVFCLPLPDRFNNAKKTQKLLICKTESRSWGAWVAQSVKHPTLDLSSGHDLTVCEFEPHIRLHADSVEPAWDSLSPSLSAPPPLALSLSLSK